MRFEVSVGPAEKDGAAGKVLVISRRSEVMMQRALLLARAGYKVTGVAGMKEARRATSAGRFDLVVIGAGIQGQERKALLELLRQKQPRAPVLAMSCPHQPGEAQEEGESAVLPEALLRAVDSILPKPRA